MMLKVENLDVFHGDAQALDGVSLEVEEGAIVAIVGANGAGKTTLIRALAGMQRQVRGRVMFRDVDSSGGAFGGREPERRGDAAACGHAAGGEPRARVAHVPRACRAGATGGRHAL